MSFVLLFYLGRLLGLVTPVMGPAFYVSHHFRYLHGSVTEWMMHRVYATIVAGPDAAEQGAVLLGGVGAMPSLHVGMVALAAYWLFVAVPRALPVALLWVALVWTATLVLGWHYALDGLGGIVTAAICIFLTKRILRRAVPAARAEAPRAAPSPG